MGQRKLNTKTNFSEHILFTNIFCTHILIPNSLHTLILAPSSIKNQSNIAIVLVSLDWYLTPKYCWKQDWLANHNRPYRNWIWEFSQNHTSGWNKNKKMHQISLCVQILTHFFLLLFRHFFFTRWRFFLAPTLSWCWRLWRCHLHLYRHSYRLWRAQGWSV